MDLQNPLLVNPNSATFNRWILARILPLCSQCCVCFFTSFNASKIRRRPFSVLAISTGLGDRHFCGFVQKTENWQFILKLSIALWTFRIFYEYLMTPTMKNGAWMASKFWHVPGIVNYSLISPRKLVLQVLIKTEKQNTIRYFFVCRWFFWHRLKKLSLREYFCLFCVLLIYL